MAIHVWNPYPFRLFHLLRTFCECNLHQPKSNYSLYILILILSHIVIILLHIIIIFILICKILFYFLLNPLHLLFFIFIRILLFHFLNLLQCFMNLRRQIICCASPIHIMHLHFFSTLRINQHTFSVHVIILKFPHISDVIYREFICPKSI